MSLLALSASLALHQDPTYVDVVKKVRSLPGVELRSEMVSPSIVAVKFLVSPQGKMVGHYPTSVMYQDAKSTLTWMPDRREYAASKSEGANPVPVGYDAMWAVSGGYRQDGPTVPATFHGHACYDMRLKGDTPYVIHLFVDKGTLLPRGTRVEWQGARHELVHRQIIVRKLADSELVFSEPADARPASQEDPSKNLVKPGARLADIVASDHLGKSVRLSNLLRARSGAVVNFWFTSCTGCVAEMPFLVKLHPDLKRKKVAMIGVNAIDSRQTVLRMSKDKSLPYTTLIGPGAKRLTSAVSVRAYPVTLVIKKDRTVVDAIMGFDEPRLRKALRSIGVQ